MDELSGRPRARLSVDERPDGRLVIELGGELDIASLPDVTPRLDELLRSAPGPACLDLAELGFLDSSGVTMLVRLANHFQPLRTLRVSQPVRRVLEVLGLRDRLGLDEDADEGADEAPDGVGA
jgi:anti-sigma B factor antagonist